MPPKILQPFQIEGRDHFARNFHAANGDQPGLGKTPQAIHAAALVGDTSSEWLVTCPASVRSNWFEHVEEHYGHTRGWEILSYDQVMRHGVTRSRYTGWIGDEIHFCKNSESKRTKAVFGRGGVARLADYKWPMSGTMAPNGRPIELWPMLKTLCPSFKDVSFAGYAQKYCGAYYDGFGWNVKGASNIDELARLLRGFMIRRTKKQVFPDRLEPLVSRVPLELAGSDMTAILAEEEAIGGRELRLSPSKEKFSQMGDTSKLLHLLGMAKVRLVSRFVHDQLETVDKVVVFFRHVEVGRQLMLSLGQSGFQPVMYRGGMSDSEKDAAKAKFMGGLYPRVLLAQQQAAGTGINGLQKVCSTAVLAEPPWTPGDTEQIIDRLDRMGQEDDLVTAYILYAKGTLDGVVVSVHDRKERTGERLMADEARGTTTANLFWPDLEDGDLLGQL